MRSLVPERVTLETRWSFGGIVTGSAVSATGNYLLPVTAIPAIHYNYVFIEFSQKFPRRSMLGLGLAGFGRNVKHVPAVLAEAGARSQ